MYITSKNTQIRWVSRWHCAHIYLLTYLLTNSIYCTEKNTHSHSVEICPPTSLPSSLLQNGLHWPTQYKSPAVGRVSRPYSWCTLATCIHNCPSMMFRTCCCLRPKCKRSYLLIYITSGSYLRSYVNKLNVRYLLEILALQIAAKQLQLATWLLLTAYRNLPIQRYHRRPSTMYRLAIIQNVTDRWQMDRTSYHKRDRTTQYGRLKIILAPYWYKRQTQKVK